MLTPPPPPLVDRERGTTLSHFEVGCLVVSWGLRKRGGVRQRKKREDGEGITFGLFVTMEYALVQKKVQFCEIRCWKE